MQRLKINPAAPARANRAKDLQTAAVYGPEHSKASRDLQRLRADYLARRCGVDRDLAAVLAGLVFGEVHQ